MKLSLNSEQKEKLLFFLIIFLGTVFSFGSFLLFYTNHYQYLGLGDSIPRLNLARKLIDNLTPGIGQLGTVWLPFPIILMLPFIWNDFLWHSGIAGSIVSMFFFILGGYYLYKLIFLITKSRLASITGFLLFATKDRKSTRLNSSHRL